MRLRKHSLAGAWIAGFAATALVLQAMLISLTPPGALLAASTDRLAAAVLCLGSRAQENIPPAIPAPAAPLAKHGDHACCILCSVPGVAAASATFTAPDWIIASAPLLRTEPARSAFRPERAPIRARAPPA